MQVVIAQLHNHGRVVVEGDAALECAKEALQRLEDLKPRLRFATKVSSCELM